MNVRRKLSTAIKVLFILIMIICAAGFTKECSKGALSGIYFCAEVLVPSIFPFMVISAFVVKSGVSAILGKYLDSITRTLFGLSGKCGAVILLSVIGGYPVGARGFIQLYEQGELNKASTRKAAYFAVGAGPGFLLSFVGVRLLGSFEIGACIFGAQVISVIILGVANKYIFRDNQEYISNNELKNKYSLLTDALVKSTVSATYGILEMCGMVVAFSAVLNVVRSMIENNSVKKYVDILFEVTSACNTLTAEKNVLLIAFSVGFAGLCVHFQIFQTLKEIGINKALFFLYRIIQGLVTALFTYIFIRVFGVTLPVFSNVQDTELSLSSSVLGSVLLVLCGVCFLYSIKKNKCGGN